MKKILLAEDDTDLATAIRQYLQLHDFEITWAENGKEALDFFKQGSFDICIIDVMMPVMDGFTLAAEMTEINPETPFIFLTAKQLKEDKIKGLQLGADDYIVKPFEPEELVLRIHNILKRSENNTIVPEKEIQIGGYLFDTHRMCLKRNGNVQQLTEKEAALLHYLYQRRNQIIKREKILQSVWKNDDFFSGRSMDVFISRLRKYFQDDERIAIESTRFIGLEFKINE